MAVPLLTAEAAGQVCRVLSQSRGEQNEQTFRVWLSNSISEEIQTEFTQLGLETNLRQPIGENTF